MELAELYSLVINNEQDNFEKNITSWQMFYNNRKEIIKNNINDQRLYFCIKYLLKNKSYKIFECFPSVIISALLREENKFINTLLISPNIKESTELILENFKYHLETSVFLNEIDFSYDHFAKFEVINYQNDILTTLSLLIKNLHENFFNFTPSLVEKIIDCIENETNLLFLNKELPSKNIDLNFIYQYLNNLLPILIYIGKDLKESIVIKKILNKEIIDKRFIIKFVQNIDAINLKNIFNNKLENCIKFINDLSNINEDEKKWLLNTIVYKFYDEEDFEILLNYCIKNHTKESLSLINITQRAKLIKYAQTKSPVELNIKIINYLLDNNYVTENFIYNLKELINSKQTKFTKEQIKNIAIKRTKYLLSLKKEIKKVEYTFEESIQLIRDYLDEKETLTLIEAKEIIKTITKKLNSYICDEEIDVYFVMSEHINGIFFKSSQIKGINLNIELIKNFLDRKMKLEERMKIFSTIFHELRHHYQYTNSISNFENYEMLKEKYLKQYDKNYYTKNYKNISTEIDARIESYNMLIKFLETLFPNHLLIIKQSILNTLKEELSYQEDYNRDKCIEVIKNSSINFNIAFDMLIQYNKNLLKSEPLFNLEYHNAGTPKTKDELLEQRTEENYLIIDEILKRRYQYQKVKKLVPNHNK